MTQTISLEEIASKVFDIRQRIRDEVDPLYKKEIEMYERNHTKPELPFFYGFTSFTDRLFYTGLEEEIKNHNQGIGKIGEKYNAHPLIKELSSLQKQCPHNYGQWETIDGPSEIRTCNTCYHKEHRWNWDIFP